MPTFHYKANHADQTTVEGDIDADDLKSARLLLEEQGLLVSSIHQVEVAQDKTVPPPTAPTTEQLTETQQLTLRGQIHRALEKGKPLAPALFAYAQELPPGRRRLRLQRMAKQLERGYDPSHELAAGQVDEDWIRLLSMGASAGDPSQAPSEIIDEFQRADDLRAQFASALAYPLLLFSASLAILLFITWWIVPTFHDIFADFGITLPAATRLALSISETTRESHGLVILIPTLVLAAIVGFIGIGPRSGFRDWLLRHIPVLGSTVRLSDRARFTRYLADLMEGEVSVADALRISGWNTGRTALRREADQLATEMDLGNTDLRDSRPSRRSLPHTVIHALQLQANPRAAALILRELSWMYDQQTRNRLAWIISAVEPVFIIFLGTAVGFYVVALMMPLVTLISNLT